MFSSKNTDLDDISIFQAANKHIQTTGRLVELDSPLQLIAFLFSFMQLNTMHTYLFLSSERA